MSDDLGFTFSLEITIIVNLPVADTTGGAVAPSGTLKL